VPAPVLAIGDGALGFWAALREVYPETREQRCWVHKIANVLDKLPKRLQAHAKEMLHKIMQAPDREEAQKELAMAYKLALAAEGHWQKVHAAQLVALVRAGARFQDGVQVAARNDSEQQVQELHEGIAA
jgi:transposase-like protein